MARVVGRNPSVDNEVAERLDAIVRLRAPALVPDERRLIVRMTIEIVRGGMRLVAQTPKGRQRAVTSEIEGALAAYLRARIGEGYSGGSAS